MAVIYNDEKQIFHLQTKGTSYVMQVVRNKYLLHLYWGKRVQNYCGTRSIILKNRGFAPNPQENDRDFSIDTLPMEYPHGGNGDFRSCAFGIREQNGSRICDLSYVGYEIMKGKPKLEGLPCSFGSEEEVSTLKIHMKDKISGLSVFLLYSVFENADVITRSVVFENRGNSPLTLTKMLSMSVDFRESGFKVMTLYGAHNNERNVDVRPLKSGMIQIESLRGTSSPQQAPFMALLKANASEESGNIYSANFVYSGNFTALAQADAFENVRFQMGMNPWNGEWYLEPNEKFFTPETVMVFSSQGLNGMSQIYHNFYQHNLIRSKFAFQPRPILINNWEATFFDFNEDKLLALADKAAQTGIELFVLDDGWFGHRDNDDSSLGDWVTDKRKLPLGLSHLSDEIHNRGLKFGLWFEPEMISRNSELFRNHPEYALHTEGRPYTFGRGQLVLDLSNDEVCRYVIESVSKVLRETKIDYVKWDMNRHLTDVGSINFPMERQGEIFHRYVLGLYKILEELTAEFPDILFESCSSGGGRFDPGMLYYMPQTWCSDNTDAVCRMKIQYATSFTYPVVTMGAHVSEVPNQQTGRVTPLQTRGQVAMSANFGYEIDLTKLSSEELDEIKKQVAFYKDIRNTIQFGKFYRIKSPFDENVAQWNFVSGDGSQVVAFHFEILSQPAAPIKILKLKGLDADAVYRDISTGYEYGGDELMYSGISVPLEKKDFRSVCFRFVKVN